MMKKTILLLLFTANLIAVYGQRTHSHQVSFDIDGFRGYVTFKTSYEGFATRLHGNNGELVITGYQATNEELAALRSAGINFSNGYRPAKFRFDVEGQAYLTHHTVNRSYRAVGKSTLRINDGLGDYTTPTFSDEAKEYARQWQEQNKGKSHWEQYGEFRAEKVVFLNISDFKNEINRVLSDLRNQKREEERQKEEEERERRELAQREADANQSSITRLGVPIGGGNTQSTASGQQQTTTGNQTVGNSQSAKSEEQLKKEKAEEDRRRAQEMIRQAELDRQRRDRQIEQGVAGVIEGGTQMVTAMTGVAGQGALHMIGIGGIIESPAAEIGDDESTLLRAEVFYRFQSSGRLAMIGDFGFGYGDIPPPEGESKYSDYSGPGFSLAFGGGYKLYESKRDKSNVMLGIQAGYSMYFGEEVSDICFPVMGFLDLSAQGVISVGLQYGMTYPLGRDDTSFGSNAAKPMFGVRVALFPF